MEKSLAFAALAITNLLAACSISSEPLVPPLGQTAPVNSEFETSPPHTVRIRQVGKTCSIPAPSVDADVLALITDGGNAATNIAVAGLDHETSAATINIEPGETPVFLFALSGQPMVWQVTGATDRVERLVVQPPLVSEGPGVAVVGLPVERVLALGADACGSIAEFWEDSGATRIPRLKAALRRPDLRFIGVDGIGTVHAPSGKPGPGNREGRGPRIDTKEGSYVIENGKPKRLDTRSRRFPELQFKRRYPAGVVMLDPAFVLSTKPVQVFELLPAEAGLLQLLAAGALTYGSDGAYMIEGPMPRIPPGLFGAYSVTFVLRDGVEKPKGSLGHSSLYREADRECLEGGCATMKSMRASD